MRIIIYATVLLAVITAGFVIREYQTQIMNFLDPEHLQSFIYGFGWWAPLVFLLISISLTLLLVSHAIFSIAAGLLFGPVGGCFLAIVSTSTAGQLAFYLARRFSGNQLESLKSRKRVGHVLSMVEEKCKTEGFKNLLLLRCLLLPYIPLSVAAGMVKTLSSRDFFLATLVAHLIITPALVLLGSTLLASPHVLIFPVAVIILVVTGSKVLKAFVARGSR